MYQHHYYWLSAWSYRIFRMVEWPRPGYSVSLNPPFVGSGLKIPGTGRPNQKFSLVCTSWKRCALNLVSLFHLSAKIDFMSLIPYYWQHWVSKFSDISKGWLSKICCRISNAMFDHQILQTKVIRWINCRGEVSILISCLQKQYDYIRCLLYSRASERGGGGRGDNDPGAHGV